MDYGSKSFRVRYCLRLLKEPIVDFKFEQVNKLQDGSYAPALTVVANADYSDHDDVHYLYKMRKALVLLVGEDNMSGFNDQQLKDIHSAIVTSMISEKKSHWYDDYSDNLDESLSEDQKEASDGYQPKRKKGILGLEDKGESIYFDMLKAYDGGEIVWANIESRDEMSEDCFLDSTNKKYPYKDQDGVVNTKALAVLLDYTGGANGVVKRPMLGAKAKRLFFKHKED